MLKPNTHNSHSMCPHCSLEASTQSDRTTFDTFTREATQENTTALINPNAKFSAVPPVCKGPGDAGFFVITRLLVRLPCIDSRVKCVTQTDRKRLHKDKRQSGGEAPPPTVLSCRLRIPHRCRFHCCFPSSTAAGQTFSFPGIIIIIITKKRKKLTVNKKENNEVGAMFSHAGG